MSTNTIKLNESVTNHFCVLIFDLPSEKENGRQIFPMSVEELTYQ